MDDAGAEDASVDSGSAPDGGPCAHCAPPSECEAVTCDGGCEYEHLPEGTPCSIGICVAGACVVRGCGDGYREPGPSPAREACDDGNVDDTDACSSMCMPRVFVIASAAGFSSWPSGPSRSAAADGRGRVLVVWSEEYSPPTGEPRVAIRTRAYTNRGVPVGVTTDVEANIGIGWEASPTVASNPAGGWVVVWRTQYVEGALGDLGGIAFALVNPSGVVGTAVRVNVDVRGDQLAPSVAALSAGFVVAWEDRSLLDPMDPDYAVRARTFGASGAATSLPMAVATSRTGDQMGPALASTGDDWIVAWTDGGGLADPSVRVRRFRAATALDVAEIDIGPGTLPSLSSTSASALVAWESRTDDSRGDVYTTTLPAGSTMIGAVTRYGTAGSADLLVDVISAPAGGHALAWQTGRRRGIELRAATPTAPPELSLLTAELMPGLQGDVSLFSAPDGLWVIWSDSGRHGDPAALRSTLGFLLSWE